MKDCMKDLETMGTRAGCAILSIGAVMFDEFGVADAGFYRSIDLRSCVDAGLVIDPKTEKWWGERSAEARKVLTDPGRVPLVEALADFANWLPKDARVWGNGADFDLPILEAAFEAVELRKPWEPYNGRCYRTVKQQFKGVKLVRVGEHHNALDDARSQAGHLVEICRRYGWRLI